MKLNLDEVINLLERNDYPNGDILDGMVDFDLSTTSGTSVPITKIYDSYLEMIQASEEFLCFPQLYKRSLGKYMRLFMESDSKELTIRNPHTIKDCLELTISMKYEIIVEVYFSGKRFVYFINKEKYVKSTEDK